MTMRKMGEPPNPNGCFLAFNLKGFNCGIHDVTMTYLNGLKVLRDCNSSLLGGRITEQSSLILVNIFPVRFANIPTGQIGQATEGQIDIPL